MTFRRLAFSQESEVQKMALTEGLAAKLQSI